MDMLTLLEDRVAHTGKLVEGVGPEQMTDPTPCARFDVRALLNHIVGGQLLLERAAAGERVQGGSQMPDVIGDDPFGAYERSSATLLAALRGPGVLERTFYLNPSVSGAEALGIAVMESVVHGWDLARATGQDDTIPPELAEGMLQAMRGQGLVDGFRSEAGDPFGPEIEVPEDASPSDKLVAYLGRRP